MADNTNGVGIGDAGIKLKQLLELQEKEASFGDIKESAVVQIVDLLLAEAYHSRASDIHIDPDRKNTIVRFRLDGVMRDIFTLPKRVHELVVTRLKILARLRTDEHLAPQDGKLQYELGEKLVDIRVSTVPTVKGENVVMRILSDDSHLGLEDLGYSKANYEKLMKYVTKPWGMILATGPVGSGKTTSLYAILKILNRREVNIITIEDPVEYYIEGITQIQVNPRAGLTFAEGLRSIVRQDPNMIMVGEIRDDETADIAVNAAMTGHLVLSTVHTNNAATTLPRFLEMGLKSFLIASTVNVVIGQRLVRTICEKCKMEYEESVEELRKHIPAPVVERGAKGQPKVRLFKGRGCEACKGMGYQGRVGIHEVMEMTKDMRELIMQGANADMLQAKAISEGMTTMLDDAFEKALAGTTTIEEILRVIK
ncbi:type II/IV secretion system protein [Candidatus Peregrinibacteria bacterium]|nr:type II/IV secretion system protein [Candidatus Peregrinibacteria bacterium]